MTRADEIRSLAARPCGVSIGDIMAAFGVTAVVAASDVRALRRSKTRPHYSAKVDGYRPRIFATMDALAAWVAQCLPKQKIKSQREATRRKKQRQAAKAAKPPKAPKPTKPAGPKLHAIGKHVEGARNNDGSKTTRHQATDGRQKLLTAPFCDREADYSRAEITIAKPIRFDPRYQVGPDEMFVGAGFRALGPGRYLDDLQAA